MFRLVDVPKAEIKSIHHASLNVLEKVGVSFPEKSALEALSAIGAEVDTQRHVVRFPEHVIKKTLGQVPRNFGLCARDKKNDVLVGNGQTFYKTSSIGLHIHDLETGKRREATREDVVRTARIVDASPNIQILDPMVVPSDVPAKVSDHYRFKIAFENCSKHICTLAGAATGTDEARDIIEIASCVAGSKEELMKRPIISLIQEATSPLQYEPLGLQAVVEFAKSNIPICISTLPAGGATAPVTLAGELVIINAEVLSGIALVQAVKRGCPVIFGSFASVMDPSKGVFLLGSPERPIMHVWVANLARYYKIPSMVGGLNSDASIPGSQSVFEKTLTTTPLVLAGADIIHGAGCLEAALTYSLEQLVMDDEIAGAISRLVRGLEVNDETLALEIIKKVGIGGHFLGEKHTRDHVVHERWFPTLFTRDRKSEDFTSSVTLDRDLARSAKEKARRILKSHQPEPLDNDIKQRIREIAAKAEKRIS